MLYILFLTFGMLKTIFFNGFEKIEIGVFTGVKYS